MVPKGKVPTSSKSPKADISSGGRSFKTKNVINQITPMKQRSSTTSSHMIKEVFENQKSATSSTSTHKRTSSQTTVPVNTDSENPLTSTINNNPISSKRENPPIESHTVSNISTHGHNPSSIDQVYPTAENRPTTDREINRENLPTPQSK